MNQHQSARLTRRAAHIVTGHAVEYELDIFTLEIRDDSVTAWVPPADLDAWLATVAYDPDEAVLHPITERGTQLVEHHVVLPVGLGLCLRTSRLADPTGPPGRGLGGGLPGRRLSAVPA